MLSLDHPWINPLTPCAPLAEPQPIMWFWKKWQTYHCMHLRALGKLHSEQRQWSNTVNTHPIATSSWSQTICNKVRGDHRAGSLHRSKKDSPAFDCFASNAPKVAILKLQDKSRMPGTLQSGKLQRLVLEEEQIATSLSTFLKQDELSCSWITHLWLLAVLVLLLPVWQCCRWFFFPHVSRQRPEQCDTPLFASKRLLGVWELTSCWLCQWSVEFKCESTFAQYSVCLHGLTSKQKACTFGHAHKTMTHPNRILKKISGV